MPNSLRAKISKLRYKGEITQEEYTELIKKLDGHDKELLDKVAERIHKKMCSENCGERQCVDAMDRCVWYGYIDEAIAEMKAEVKE